MIKTTDLKCDLVADPPPRLPLLVALVVSRLVFRLSLDGDKAGEVLRLGLILAPDVLQGSLRVYEDVILLRANCK